MKSVEITVLTAIAVCTVSSALMITSVASQPMIEDFDVWNTERETAPALSTMEPDISVEPEELEPLEIEQKAVFALTASNVQLSAKDKEVLLTIAEAEAGGEDVVGKALVMRVVLNRVASKEWPNDVYSVVFQKGQFSPATVDGRYFKVTPDNGCYQALEMIENGWDESRGAMYFESGGTWHKNHCTYLFQHGCHRFYK